MKIIKQGDPGAVKRRVCFRCRECGCVFEAEPGEYTIESNYNDHYYSCRCPTCSTLVVFFKP